jgi:hypothetical protein
VLRCFVWRGRLLSFIANLGCEACCIDGRLVHFFLAVGEKGEGEGGRLLQVSAGVGGLRGVAGASGGAE